MKSKERPYKWIIGNVSESKEHIKISFGSFEDTDWDQFIPVARLSAHGKDTFVVEFLIKYRTLKEKMMIDAAKNELDLYLKEVPLGDPWGYVIYHCNTTSNIYSNVHWSYFPEGSTSGQKGINSEVVIKEKIDRKGKKIREKIIIKKDFNI